MMKMIRTFLRFVAANALPADLFNPSIDIPTAKKLFHCYVKIVEIENHSYCNRTCWFCPNSFIDRHSGNTLMEPGLYQKILGDLASIDFDQALIWCGYHEPLADSSIYANIAEARKALPRAYLRINTNGDFLTREVLCRLEAAGLDQITVSLYPTANCGVEGKDLFEGPLRSLQQRVGLKVVKKTRRYQGLQLESAGCLIPIELKDFQPLNMSSRGGVLGQVSGLQTYQRSVICFNPLQHLSISFSGIGMLCCEVRADVPAHAEAIVGDLNTKGYSLFHLYRDLAPARGALLRSGKKSGVCKTCNVNAKRVSPYSWGRIAKVARIFQQSAAIRGFMAAAWIFPRTSRDRYKIFRGAEGSLEE